MEKQYVLPAGLRDALIAFLMREMPMAQAEEPVNHLRRLQQIPTPAEPEPPAPALLDTPA